VQAVAALISILASSIFIWMILRSQKRLSTPYHRLIIGLCVTDILFSLPQATCNMLSPAELDYRVWNARGNEATCDAHGFIQHLGLFGGLLYNCSLSFYYLAVIKYEKKDEYIRDKLEPFLHGIPIIVTLTYNIYRLIGKHYNDNGGGYCGFSNNNPYHCLGGYEIGETRDGFDIPCGRGFKGHVIVDILDNILLLGSLVIIMISLRLIYRAVLTQEQKMDNYGLNAQLRLLRRASTSQVFHTQLAPSCPTLRRSGSRNVMYKAAAYSCAFFLVWTPSIIVKIVGNWPIPLEYIHGILNPLQGLFNLLIYMHPRILAAKRSKHKNISWCQAFGKAFWAIGGDSRTNIKVRVPSEKRRFF